MFTWKRCGIAACIMVALSLAFVTLILPGMIVERASRFVAEEFGRELTIESLSINPFGLTFEIENLALSDTDHDKTFVSFELLRTSLSTSSIFRMAPVIDELTLQNPNIQLERLTENTFNFSDLLPAKSEEPKDVPEDGEPARFSINNINISGGNIELLDLSLREPIHHEVTDLQLVLPSIGNLPHMVEDPSQPYFKAVFNDSPIVIEGHMKPFTTTLEMVFNIGLSNKDIPFYLSYIPVELPVDVRNGKLNLNLEIIYRYSQEHGNELILSGKGSLTSLNIWDNQQEQLFFMPLLQLELAPSQPLKQDIHLSALRVYNLEVQLNRNMAGEWNHARMAQQQAKQEPAIIEEQEEDTESAKPFKLQIDTVEIRDGVINFVDELPVGGFASVAKEININVKNFSLDTQKGIPFDLSLKTGRDEAATAKGHFQLAPFSLVLHTSLNEIQLGAYEPYYREVYNQSLGGTLTLDANLLISPEQPLLLSKARVSLRNLYGAFNEEEGVAIDTFDVEGLSFDLARNRLEVGAVASRNARIKFSRNKQGAWSFMSRNFPILAKLSEASDVSENKPETQSEASGPAFSYRIDNVDISRWQLDIYDRLPATPAHTDIDDLSLSIRDLAAPEKVMSPFTLSMTLQRKGQVDIEGTTTLTDLKTSASTRLRAIPLVTLAPYVAEQTNLVLADGLLDAQLKTVVTPDGDDLEVSYGGKIGVNRMHLLDSLHEEDLLKWGSLQIADISGKIDPLSLEIGSITLSNYFAKVLIDEEARVNLVNAFKKDVPAEDEDATEENPSVEQDEDVAVQEKAPGPEEKKTAHPDIRINKVVLQGGQVDFTDRSLPQPFSADMTELGGRIDGLSSHERTQATVDLRGSLRNQSPLTISGQLNPLAEDIFLDIDLSFHDIEMSPFSPYSGNFVGYMIEKGKLNLTLDYTIEDHQLKANNKVFLDQFSFGEAVESENATSLPVKLAIALLKDGNGEIHLDIPVSGNLDDPQFSIGGVVWTVIKNLLIKAATSPFALLGALVGGGEEDFSSINFDYGSQRLSASEMSKLEKMAKALLERPALVVDVSGFIDPDNDPEGYRREQLSLKVKRLKYLDLVKKGDFPEDMSEEDVTIPAEEYTDYLWQVYKKEDFPKPRNFIGMTKQLPDQEMEKLIYANTIVEEEDLAQLAQARALAVQNYLTEVGKLPAERIFLKKPDIAAAPDQETANRARVELGASVK